MFPAIAYAREEGLVAAGAQNGKHNQDPDQHPSSPGHNPSRSRHRPRSPPRDRHHSRPRNDYLIIETFEGRSGDGIDRFLRAAKMRLDRNVQCGKYYSEEEKNADHVALIHNHCGPRVRELSIV